MNFRDKIWIATATAVFVSETLVGSPSTVFHLPSEHLPPDEQRSSVECQAFLDNELGNFHMPIAANAKAQKHFNQGMTLLYGFNHGEAIRSFKLAAAFEPRCAICYWGWAYALGPNINAPMNIAANEEAWVTLNKALSLVKNGSQTEQALIHALATRYEQEASTDRTHLDEAYADAMADVAKRFPHDPNVLALAAEAAMDTSPWDYWDADLQPRPITTHALKLLDQALAFDINHIGANHFLIHMVELAHPKAGISAADRLSALAPGAGHLVHMPSHIYMRVGRYHDATIANEKAVIADRRYMDACQGNDFYNAMYVAHNWDFLVAAASIEGRKLLAQSASLSLSSYIKTLPLHHQHMPFAQQSLVLPLLTAVRFQDWNLIRSWPKPEQHFPYAEALWHYAQSHAFLASGKIKEAKEHFIRLNALKDDPAINGLLVMGMNKVGSILNIAALEVQARLQVAEGDQIGAVPVLKEAVRAQDQLLYMEPPVWHRPVRLVLGELLLRVHRFQEAQQIYREDLEVFPNSAWSLEGLKKSLVGLNLLEEAKVVGELFDQAWQYADLDHPSSQL